MPQTEVPIYRPEITVHRRSRDGEWDVAHPGTITNTLFYPLPDEDGTVTEAGLRRSVRLGTEPFFRMLIPDGAGLVEVGRATFLRMPDGKKYDGITALAFAKTRSHGLDLVRPARPAAPAPAPAPVAAVPPRPAAPPPAPKGRTVQLSMFGD